MPIFLKDDTQLMNMLAKLTHDVTEEASNTLYRDVKASVLHNVYEYGYHPKIYKRQLENRGFLGSWVIEDDEGANLLTGNTEYTFNIYSDPEELKLDGSEYVHGNPEGDDRREFLYIFLQEGIVDTFDWRGEGTDRDESTMPWLAPRDYWTEIERQLEPGKEMDKHIEFELEARGFKKGVNFVKIK